MSRSIFKLGLLSVLSALSISIGAWADGDISRGKGSDAGEPFPRIKIDKLIVMPMASSHSDWIEAIKNAKTSIHMEMFHITEKVVIDALIARAHDNIDMRIVVDNELKGGYKVALDTLVNAGVKVRPGSSAYSLTHSKTMVVDGKMAWITSINLTNTGTGSKDYGILTPDTDIIAEIERVFEADWKAAGEDSKIDTTPAVSHPNLLWSPTNSINQLKKLVESANETLDVEVENIGAEDLINAFNAAAAKGVKVRLIIPKCTGNNKNNYAALGKLKGVDYHVEPDSKSLERPYMHAKMIVADGKRNYIGSVNFSYNSTTRARELGVIFLDEEIGATLSSEFKKDWDRSEKTGLTPDCGSSKDKPEGKKPRKPKAA